MSQQEEPVRVSLQVYAIREESLQLGPKDLGFNTAAKAQKKWVPVILMVVPMQPLEVGSVYEFTMPTWLAEKQDFI